MLTLEELYREYAEGLQAYASRLTREPQSAEDLVQEAFIRTLPHLQLLAQLNVHQRRAWLCQTVKRLFLDRRASRARETAAIPGSAKRRAWPRKPPSLPASRWWIAPW